MSALFVAWFLSGVTLLLAVADFVLIALSRPDEWVVLPVAMVNATLGLLIVRRHRRHLVGWAFCVAGTLFGFLGFCLGYTVRSFVFGPRLPGAIIAAWLANWAWIFPVTIVILVIPMLFPDGRLTSRRWRWVLGGGLAAAGLAVVATAFDPSPLEPTPGIGRISNPFGATGSLGSIMRPLSTVTTTALVASMVAAAASVVVRFRRSKGAERQQLKWLAYAAALTGILMVLISPYWETRGGQILGPMIFLLVPAAAGIAILRHRLYDIDLVIKRTVVYGILAALITGLYALIVIVPAAAIFDVGGANFLLPLLGTALIALVFHPARQRAQRFANRMVYGNRLSPYEAMAEFSERMAGALTLEEVLPRMAESSARGLGAERARVTIFLPDGTERAATWPDGSADASFETKVAVAHGGEEVGEISLTKPRSEPITAAEEKLLQDLASQAGPALHNVRLAEDLRASRRRIVSAQDEERRRLERNLHDGAQQGLVALKVKLGLAERLAEANPLKARELLTQLQGDADETLENMRDLARGIYPPLLADRGLAEALRAQALKSAVPVGLAADDVGRHPQEIEAAIYFCCLEALQNIAKYANANLATITLSSGDAHIRFEVSDDGGGFEPGSSSRGTGLQNMVDRVHALGGSLEVRSAPGEGTKVIGSLPV